MKADSLALTTPSLYDTSLRDGLQGEKTKLTLSEKLAVAQELDTLGLDYIEGGFPLASPSEKEFFDKALKLNFRHAKLVAFGSTRSPKSKVENDFSMKALLSVEVPAIAVVGKSWTSHVTQVLRTSLDENLRLIEETVAYLKRHGKEVIYDAEHFFDGFFENSEYAMKTLEAAMNGGADILVLCDTNGGSIHTKFREVLKQVEKQCSQWKTPYGVHLHDDLGLAVANSLLALEYGAKQIQGTLNGWGERCGNANLSLIIPNLQIKMGLNIISDTQLKRLNHSVRLLNEHANMATNEKQGYIGRSSFAHKGGQHADVLMKNNILMEHINPALVGNERRVLLSELAGKASLVYTLQKSAGLSQNGELADFTKNSPLVAELTKLLKNKEQLGYEYETAMASFELLIHKSLHSYKSMFQLIDYRVEVERSSKPSLAQKAGEQDTALLQVTSIAFVRLRVNGILRSGIANGDGPVSSLDLALRQALEPFYPFLKNVKLTDYKVRVLDSNKSTSARTRVFISSAYNADADSSLTQPLPPHLQKWETVGVSQNIIDSSWQALIDSFEFFYNKYRVYSAPSHAKPKQPLPLSKEAIAQRK